MIIIHEFGHAIAMLLIGGKIKGFEISLSSVKGKFQYPNKINIPKYLFFTLNGVLFQLLVSLIVIITWKSTVLSIFSLFYLCVIAINFVPLSITDGSFVYKIYPAFKLKVLLWSIAILLIILSSFGLLILWESSIYFKWMMTAIYLLLITMTLRRIGYLYLEDKRIDHHI
jgi:hypothetical protein